jgi:hypothetical protein
MAKKVKELNVNLSCKQKFGTMIFIVPLPRRAMSTFSETFSPPGASKRGI